MSIVGGFLFAMVLGIAAETANAHQSSFTYASLSLSDSGRRIDYEIRLSSNDLFEALALGTDRDATDAEITGGAAALQTYVFDRVHLRAANQACETVTGPVSVVMDGQRFARVVLSLLCPTRISSIVLSYELFFDLDEQHEGLLRIGDGLVQLTSGSREYRHVLGTASPETSLGFLVSGAKHVLYGWDHILFILSLIMVMGLRKAGSGFCQRSTRDTIRNAALIATAFTVGHSITLVVAALGWIWLPSRFVESMIAASIVYVAIENVLRPDPPRRYILTFAFGLMHGLGFASMLRPLLPPESVVLPLLVFNVGVEVGQIIVLAGAIPLLGIVMHVIGVLRYRSVVVPVSSAVLAGAGLMWLAERALGW